MNERIPGLIAAEDYRLQLQEADARRSGIQLLGRDALVAWTQENRELVLEMTRQRGFSEVEAEEAFQTYLTLLAGLPEGSALDELNGMYILKDIIARIENTCRGSRIPLYEGVVIGTRPTDGIEVAQRAVLQTEASIISVSLGFLPFCNIASKIVALCMPHTEVGDGNWNVSNDPKEFERALRENDQLVREWIEFIGHFACTGRPPQPRPIPLNRGRNATQILLLKAMELFAIAHEYGHHVLQHGQRESSDSGDEVMQEELAADLFALSVCKAVDDPPGIPNPFAISGAGSILVLGLMDIVRRSREILTSGSESQSQSLSHPPFVERVANLGRLDSLVPLEDRETCRDMRNCFEQIVNCLWHHLKPLIVELYREGVRADVSFDDRPGWLPLYR